MGINDSQFSIPTFLIPIKQVFDTLLVLTKANKTFRMCRGAAKHAVDLLHSLLCVRSERQHHPRGHGDRYVSRLLSHSTDSPDLRDYLLAQLATTVACIFFLTVWLSSRSP